MVFFLRRHFPDLVDCFYLPEKPFRFLSPPAAPLFWTSFASYPEDIPVNQSKRMTCEEWCFFSQHETAPLVYFPPYRSEVFTKIVEIYRAFHALVGAPPSLHFPLTETLPLALAGLRDPLSSPSPRTRSLVVLGSGPSSFYLHFFLLFLVYVFSSYRDRKP